LDIRSIPIWLDEGDKTLSQKDRPNLPEACRKRRFGMIIAMNSLVKI
jgi:hypothetical protein